MMSVRTCLAAVCVFTVQMLPVSEAAATEFFRPWADPKRAIVLDGYEHNVIDLQKVAGHKRVTAFIHKGSDGLPPPWRCEGNEAEKAFCRTTWQRYVISRELYQTRRALAKNLGLKWGAYHLGRAGDPLEQARHFIDFADPQPDELVAIDIEGLDSEKWMSLEDAERFAVYIRSELGRYPVLYANDVVARKIAENSSRYRILSRLPLWYARFKPAIRGVFPKGNWDSYQIWQFSHIGNCTEKRCAYRVAGTDTDIDVNIVDMTPDQLRLAWPLGHLLEDKTPFVYPIPVARPDRPAIENRPDVPVTRWAFEWGTQEALSWRRRKVEAYRQYASLRLDPASADAIDPVTTAAFRQSARSRPVNDLY